VLVEQASDSIRELLRERRLDASEGLTEAALAQQLGMSRTPVRTALFRLEDAGLVERTTGRGWRVCRLSKQDVEEIFEMKTALEVLAVRLATQRMSPAQGARLLELSGKLEASASSGDLDSWLACDADFHNLIVRATGNQRLLRAVAMLNDQWYRVRPAYMAVSGRALNAAVEHRIIAEAMIAGDAEAACAAAQEHMERVHDAVRESMRAILRLVGGDTL